MSTKAKEPATHKFNVYADNGYTMDWVCIIEAKSVEDARAKWKTRDDHMSVRLLRVSNKPE